MRKVYTCRIVKCGKSTLSAFHMRKVYTFSRMIACFEPQLSIQKTGSAEFKWPEDDLKMVKKSSDTVPFVTSAFIIIVPTF